MASSGFVSTRRATILAPSSKRCLPATRAGLPKDAEQAILLLYRGWNKERGSIQLPVALHSISRQLCHLSEVAEQYRVAYFSAPGEGEEFAVARPAVVVDFSLGKRPVFAAPVEH